MQGIYESAGEIGSVLMAVECMQHLREKLFLKELLKVVVTNHIDACSKTRSKYWHG